MEDGDDEMAAGGNGGEEGDRGFLWEGEGGVGGGGGG